MLVAIVAATMSYAQSSLLATLSHNGEISAYYGTTALQEAYNAAEHGDIITLSSGTFAAVDIEKALTIRGAGMQADTVTNALPTNITGDFTINIPESTEHRLTMEGLYHNNTIKIGTLKNASFLKDRLNAITYVNANTSSVNGLTILHCKITSSFNIPGGSASFINSFINSPSNAFANSNSHYEYLNCVIRTNSLDLIRHSSFTNCIIYSSNNTTYLPSTNTAFYCVGKYSIIGNNRNMFTNLANSTTNTNFTDEISALFKTYTGTYSDTETFELTDEAKTKYLGSDGTEVGMYGGNLPFDPTLANLRITKCNVASKSTADGKLSVDIEVTAAE